MQYYYTHTYVHVHACPGATGTHIVYMRSFVHALAEVVLQDVRSRDGVLVHTYISSISTCTGRTVRERAPLARRRAMSAAAVYMHMAHWPSRRWPARHPRPPGGPARPAGASRVACPWWRAARPGMPGTYSSSPRIIDSGRVWASLFIF